MPEGARVTVRFVNGTDWPTAIHWHGLRLENRFDGVPHLTQPPVEPGSSFDYRLTFPDPGVFWYHPHHREDVLQDLGLYSNILVRSPRPRFSARPIAKRCWCWTTCSWARAGWSGMAASRRPTRLMGRFGNGC